MQRLTAQDSVFLHLEGPNTPYHVASLMLFDGGPFEVHALHDLIASRLHLVPRLRQRLAQVPLSQGRPVWVDDEHFDLEYHVRSAVVPGPGTLDQALHVCSELMAQHLDRSRPLWELYVLDGLEDGRIGVFAKTHHAMIDGIAGIDVAALLLDGSPEHREPLVTPVWTPRSSPSRVRLLAGAVADNVLRPVGALIGAGRALRQPRRLVAEALTDVEGLGSLAWSGLHPAPACGLNVPIGPNRRLVTVRSSLADFLAIRERFGGTVNDVVLAAVCGGLRTWLAKRGELIDGMELHAMVPVSTRTDHDDGIGNHVSTILAPLPVGDDHPRRRYTRISDGVRHAKHSHQVVGADLLMQLSGYAPPTVVAQIARLQNAQRFFNLSITNIPGPPQPLYALGRELVRFVPFTPLPANMALIVAVISYAGHMEFGLTVDVEAIDDVDVIATGILGAIDELKDIAGVGPRPPQGCEGP